MKIKTKLAKLSLCACGFTVLNEGIPLGTDYVVDLSLWTQSTMTCGGCGKDIPVLCVMVEGRNGGPRGFLPHEIFDLEPSLIPALPA